MWLCACTEENASILDDVKVHAAKIRLHVERNKLSSFLLNLLALTWIPHTASLIIKKTVFES